MNVVRQEIRTGLLVVFSLSVLVAVLLYLGAPGVFVPMKTFWVYVENAAGLTPGDDVLLGGRRIGQVRRLYSPVPEVERPSEAPKAETLIEVRVERSAAIYRNVKVYLTQNGLLGQMLLDFTSGSESDGPAPSGAYFVATRPPGLNDAAPLIMEKLDPAIKQATATLDVLQKAAENITMMTSEGGDLQLALAEYKKFGGNLNELSGPDSSLRHAMMNLEAMTSDTGKLGESLENIRDLTSPGGSLSNTFKNAEKFTQDLSNNKDINATLKNLRQTSSNLNCTISELGGRFSVISHNLEQATDTVKRQPWRLIWPSTKKYGDEPKKPSRPLFGFGAQQPMLTTQPLVVRAAPAPPPAKATPTPRPRARRTVPTPASPPPAPAGTRQSRPQSTPAATPTEKRLRKYAGD